MKAYIIFSLCFLSFYACVINPEPIDVIIPEDQPEVVVSSLAIPPFISAVSLTHTFSAISGITDSVDLSDPVLANKILVDSADVYIDYEGKSVKLQKILPGIFGTIDIPLKENTVYTLKATDHSLKKEIIATTTIMPKVSLDSLIPVVIAVDDTSSIHTFRYSFKDIIGQDNYYMVTATKASLISKVQNDIEKVLSDFVNPGYELYTDKLYGDGKSIAYSPEFTNYDSGDSIIISLSHITKAHFDYLTAYKKSGNFFNSFLSEPTRTFPSNVKNGFGFFSLTLPDVRLIVLK
jgi:Domain of unknown function (DUF4249)